MRINPTNFWSSEILLTQQIESGLRRLSRPECDPQIGVLLEQFAALVEQVDEHIGIVSDLDPAHKELQL